MIMKKVILGLSILVIVGMFLVIGVILIGNRQKQAGISTTQEEQAIEESGVNQFLQLDFIPLGQKYVFFDKESANHYYFTWNGASEEAITITTYNKAIRDKIPEIIEDTGRKGIVKQVTDEEFLPELEKKLHEEITEYLSNRELEELAEVFEVIYRILKLRNINIIWN